MIVTNFFGNRCQKSFEFVILRQSTVPNDFTSLHFWSQITSFGNPVMFQRAVDEISYVTGILLVFFF